MLEEFALVLISVRRAPWRERGGGGGDFAVAMDEGSLVLGAGLGREGSMECWEDMVREELLRDLLPVVDERSWDCLRAKGTGGGALFCGRVPSDVNSDSLEYCCIGVGRCCEESCVLMCRGGGDTTGVGGSGLFMSELSFDSGTGGIAGSDAAKLSNDTVCGCL